MKRRRFIVKAGGVLATAGAAAVIDAPNVISQPKVQWRMSTSWTPALTPGSENYAALERDVIDASEWIGPHEDMKLGLHKTAQLAGWSRVSEGAYHQFVAL